MKKITIILILILFFVYITVFKPASSYAWDDCVFGETNDSFPGDCASYIDTDHDNICDHSQPAPENRIISELPKKENIQETQSPIVDKPNQTDYHLGLTTIILFLGYGASFLRCLSSCLASAIL